MILNTVESFLNKSFFYSGCNKLWVVQNSFPILNKLNKVNVKERAKSVSTFYFSTLYVAIPSSSKYFQKLSILHSNLKLENTLAF